jgi:hypothetical protein
MMKRICGLLFCFLVAYAELAPALDASTRQFQKAVVVSAQKYEPDTPHRSKRTDAPAPPTEYDYDVAIRVNCSVYVGRYLSGIDYLPDLFSPNQSVEVSLDKHYLYVRNPGSRDIKMGIVRNYAESGDSCGTSR